MTKAAMEEINGKTNSKDTIYLADSLGYTTGRVPYTIPLSNRMVMAIAVSENAYSICLASK